jgi:hypothetical protein
MKHNDSQETQRGRCGRVKKNDTLSCIIFDCFVFVSFLLKSLRLRNVASALTLLRKTYADANFLDY